MKMVTEWMKSNPLMVVSIVLAVAAIGFFAWVQMQTSTLKANMLAVAQKRSQPQRYLHQTIEIPSFTLGGKPKKFTDVVINQQAIDGLLKQKTEINQQQDQLEKLIAERNKKTHHVLIPGLFSNPQMSQSDTVRIHARTAYLKTLKVMLQNIDAVQGAREGEQAYPQLNAGMPVSMDELKRVLDQVNTELKNENFNIQENTGNRSGTNRGVANGSSGSNNTLSQADRRRIHQRRQAALIASVEARAKSIPIYANTQSAIFNKAYPLMADDELKPNMPPSMAQLWEAQLELWIQQDVIRAIVQVNHQVNPGGNVIGNPIKRLIKMRVVPGYVGVNTSGAMPNAVSNASNSPDTAIHFFSLGGNTDKDMAIGGQSSLKAFFSSGNQSSHSSRSNFSSRTPGPQAKASGQAPSSDFQLSPTGRISNQLYDVRQVKVSLIADYSQLPLLFNTLSNDNFMTVLTCNVHAVNPYAALSEGYDYGEGSIVRVDLLIETLWMRSWTSSLMPKQVRELLGINTASSGNKTPPAMSATGGH